MNNKKPVLIRMIVLFAVLAIAFLVGWIGDWIDFYDLGDAFGDFQGVKLLYLLCMVCGVLLVETLIVFILGLFEPENHRVRSEL